MNGLSREKENIVLADCENEEVLPLAQALSYESCPFHIKVHIANWKRTGKLSELKRYAKYFAVAFRYFLGRKKYKAIVGWQQFYALIFCFYCELFSVRKTNIVAALNFTYKEKQGKLGKLYKWFMEKCVSSKYLDYIHVPSSDYADIFHHEFGFPRDRIMVTPFGVNDEYERLCDLEPPEGFRKDGYALAIGRSNRDYDFLISAWEEIDFPLVIISDTYKRDITANSITLLTDVAGEASYPWIVNCGVMVIPIDDGTICSGDTVLLTAMSLKRKIIVTAPSTLAEMYIVDGENAVLSQKNKAALKTAVTDVLYASEYGKLGDCARECFLKEYTRSSMGYKLAEILNSRKEEQPDVSIMRNMQL